ncbi:unnamed protein product [Medioppia subpectinata]|uniref:Protein kinase domain-containing protein n=1 Tax=Medioppia subpectinata TaxID=1979941 RepID=A0A7R9PZJ6_9ACAR|nr:unnamed protein product [Medioppia subpectinata]CAG2106530.1 unnamed protein product [Medioppia subpectinata]
MKSLDVMSIDGNNASGSQLSQPMDSLNDSLSAMDICDVEGQESHNNFYIDNFDQLKEIGNGGFNNDQFNDGNYKIQFIEMSAIGSGGFGTVFKVKHRLDDKIYAVKRVQFGGFSEEKKQKVIKEVKSLAKMESEFVIKYYNSWLESNHLYIQMQFCPQSLRSLLKDKPIVFQRQPEDQMNAIEYFISCEIFRELLECVQYLHESNPVVIHRDLKPENILIDYNFSFNRFVKLCDFGLATEHNTDRQTASRYGHTLGVGTKTYMSPEVYHYKQYNHKTDIYSLALIAEEIYSIDPQNSLSSQAIETEFNKYYNNLYQTLQSMQSSPDYQQRPECRVVLAKHSEWSIDKTDSCGRIYEAPIGDISANI